MGIKIILDPGETTDFFPHPVKVRANITTNNITDK
jgi:hypothetical protein